MYTRFTWTPASHQRLNLTAKYEPLQPFLFVQFAKSIEATSIVDVGANIGQYSLFARQADSVKAIYAFEPEEAAYREMEANIGMNGLGGTVKGFMQAVSSRKGPVDFGVVGAMAGNNAVSTTTIHDRSVYRETRVIAADTLDNVLSFRGERMVVKIDVEGHEMDVLKGATAILSQNQGVVQVEVYNNAKSVADALAILGYRKLIAIGPDVYFSNIYKLQDAAMIIEIVEGASASLIDYNLRG